MKVLWAVWITTLWTSVKAGPVPQFNVGATASQGIPTGSVVTSIRSAQVSQPIIPVQLDGEFDVDAILRMLTSSPGGLDQQANTVNRQGILLQGDEESFGQLLSGGSDFGGAIDEDILRIVNTGSGFTSPGVSAGGPSLTIGGGNVGVPLPLPTLGGGGGGGLAGGASSFGGAGGNLGFGGAGGSIGGGAAGGSLGGLGGSVGVPLSLGGGAGFSDGNAGVGLGSAGGSVGVPLPSFNSAGGSIGSGGAALGGGGGGFGGGSTFTSGAGAGGAGLGGSGLGFGGGAAGLGGANVISGGLGAGSGISLGGGGASLGGTTVFSGDSGFGGVGGGGSLVSVSSVESGFGGATLLSNDDSHEILIGALGGASGGGFGGFNGGADIGLSAGTGAGGYLPPTNEYVAPAQEVSIVAPTNEYAPPAQEVSIVAPTNDYLPPTKTVVTETETIVLPPIETVVSSPAVSNPIDKIFSTPAKTSFTNSFLNKPDIPILGLSPNVLDTLFGGLKNKLIDPTQTLGSLLRGLDGQDGIVVVDIDSQEVATALGQDTDSHETLDFDFNFDSIEDDSLIFTSGGGGGSTLGTSSSLGTKAALGPKQLFREPLSDIFLTKGQWLGTILGGLVDIGDTVVRTFSKDKF